MNEILNDPLVNGLGVIVLLVIFFGLPKLLERGKSGPGRPRGLGRAVALNAWNDRMFYTSGVMTDVDDGGQLHAYYQTEDERRIAEEFFPEACIQKLNENSRFKFEHPSYGCVTTNKNDPRFKTKGKMK